MTRYLRYFLALSLIFSTVSPLSAQDTGANQADKKSALAELGQSMKDFTKRIKRYYACAKGECSQQEMNELKKHIWSDGAILVTALAGAGLGSYLIYSKMKPNLIAQELRSSLSAEFRYRQGLANPEVKEQGGEITITFKNDMPKDQNGNPDTNALYALAGGLRGSLYAMHNGYTSAHPDWRKISDKEYGRNLMDFYLRQIPVTIQFNNRRMNFEYDGIQSRGFLAAYDSLFEGINDDPEYNSHIEYKPYNN